LANSKSDIETLMKEAGSSAEDTISKKGNFASDSSSGSTSAIGKSSSGGRPNQVLIRKSEKAYAILLNLLDDDLIDLIAHVEAGDAHRVWTVLLETYEAKSTASLCYKLDQLMNIQFRSEKETFDMFKARLTRLISEVKTMGEIISPVIQRYVLLKSLPQTYDALVQSLKINDNISIEEVYTHIKDYVETERRRKTKSAQPDQSIPEEEKALATLTGFNKHTKWAKKEAAKVNRQMDVYEAARKKRNNRDKVECYTCGFEGHTSNLCTLKDRLHCSRCKERGHLARYCKAENSDSELSDDEEHSV